MIDQVTLRPILGSNIARLRAIKGMTQRELAEKLRISPIHLNRIEKGKASPGAELLFSLADMLGVRTDELRQLPVDSH